MIWLKYFENFNKNWELLLSNPDKRINGERLIDLVKIAYNKTPLGSFVKTLSDVIKSSWYIIDWDEKGDIDACIFYRKPRKGEKWKGKKIQGIGHDGESKSKEVLLEKLIDVLDQPGNWVEASDKLETILEMKKSPKVTDINTLEKLFPNSKIIEILPDGRYKRTLNDKIITESVFGNPEF
jgi:hypothetical protein